MAGVDLCLQLVDGQHNVLIIRMSASLLVFDLCSRCDLEDLLGEGHGPHGGRGGELHEGGLGRQHPAQQQQEQRVVAEGDHGLQHPEDGLMMMMIMSPYCRIVMILPCRVSAGTPAAGCTPRPRPGPGRSPRACRTRACTTGSRGSPARGTSKYGLALVSTS